VTIVPERSPCGLATFPGSVHTEAAILR
jgi:hypothetical protein